MREKEILTDGTKVELQLLPNTLGQIVITPPSRAGYRVKRFSSYLEALRAYNFLVLNALDYEEANLLLNEAETI